MAAIITTAGTKVLVDALVAVMPTGVLVDTRGRIVSDEFRVRVDDSGSVTNVDPVDNIVGRPIAVRLLGADGSWQEISLTFDWAAR